MSAAAVFFSWTASMMLGAGEDIAIAGEMFGVFDENGEC